MKTTITNWISAAAGRAAGRARATRPPLREGFRATAANITWLALGLAVLCPHGPLQAQSDGADIRINWSDCDGQPQQFEIHQDPQAGSWTNGPQPIFDGWFPEGGVQVTYGGASAITNTNNGGAYMMDIVHYDLGPGPAWLDIITNLNAPPGYYSFMNPTRSGIIHLHTEASGLYGDFKVNPSIQIALPGDNGGSGSPGPGGQPPNSPAAPAPPGGCCGSGGKGSPKPLATASGLASSLEFRFNHGPSSTFADGGYVWLYAGLPSAALARPSALVVPFVRDNVTVITNAGLLRQTTTPLGLMNVASNSAYQYQLQFFYKTNMAGLTNGLYGTNAPAFASWVVTNPDSGTASNRLWITEKRPGVPDRQFQYTYTNNSGQANRWDLLKPDGLTTLSVWQVTNAANYLVTNYLRQVTSGANLLRSLSVTLQVRPRHHQRPHQLGDRGVRERDPDDHLHLLHQQQSGRKFQFQSCPARGLPGRRLDLLHVRLLRPGHQRVLGLSELLAADDRHPARPAGQPLQTDGLLLCRRRERRRRNQPSLPGAAGHRELARPSLGQLAASRGLPNAPRRHQLLHRGTGVRSARRKLVRGGQPAHDPLCVRQRHQ